MARASRKSPVGRPPYTPAQQEAIRERILAIARTLFAEEGFESVSMRRIAARVDCAPMTLYRYFANKRALLRHIWEDVFVDVFARCEEAVAGETDPTARLRAFAHAYLAYWFEQPDHYRLIFLNQDEVEPGGDRYYVESSAIVERFKSVERDFAAGIAAGVLRDADPELLAQEFLCALHGLALCVITIPEYPWRDRTQLAAGLVDTLLAGFARRAS